MGVDARSDEAIINTINYCLKNEITKINVLLIFVSFETGIGKDDIDAFQSFFEKFSHKSIKIGICVTRSEDKNQHWQDNIRNQLNQHVFFSKILKNENVSLCFIGCVDPQKTSIISAIADIKNLYVKVYNLRKTVLEIVFGANSQVGLLELPIATSQLEDLGKQFGDQNDILTFLENNNDFVTATAKEKIKKFALNLDSMTKSEGLLLDPKMHGLFTQMRTRVTSLKKKMDPKQFNEFKGKLIID